MNRLKQSQPDWLDTARRLRKVRQACLLFLDRWAISHLLSDAPALDRVAVDIHSRQKSDSKNSDWSYLYRGSVLDD